MSDSGSITSPEPSTPEEIPETLELPLKQIKTTIEKYQIASFDIALKHFAIRGEIWSKEGVKPLIFEFVSFELKSVNRELLMTIIEYLDRHDWGSYDCVVIEGQIAFIRGFGGAAIANAKIQQILETYFYCRYPDLEVVIIPSKSKYPKSISGKTSAQRKKWAVVKVREILEKRGDLKSLKVLDRAEFLRKTKQDPNSKTDDLADACLLILAYLQKRKDFPFPLEAF